MSVPQEQSYAKNNYAQIEDNFRAAMAEAGLHTKKPLIADAQIRRFHVEGDSKGTQNGWYVIFTDGYPSGTFGCWKRDFQLNWHYNKHKPDREEALALERRLQEAQKQREAREGKARQRARQIAKRLLSSADTANPDHPYLKDKGISPHGIHQNGQELLIPMYDTEQTLHSLQFIYPNGSKRFLKGGQKKACFTAIGEIKETICIAEGYATAASIYESTGYYVAVAFDAGNLEPVAKALRKKHPEAKIVLCADNDWQREGNPGITKAKSAAKAVRGYLAYTQQQGLNDLNDLHKAEGRDAVQQVIDKAQIVKASRALYRNFSEIEAKPVNWLWPGRIARGKVTILAGEPGLGKSQVSNYMAANVTHARQWPDNTECPQGDVILISAEDDPSDTIRPRLEASGANLNKVHMLDAILQNDDESNDGIQQQFFNLEKGLLGLRDMLDDIVTTALIVIDPISAFLGSADSHKDAPVRQLLMPLEKIAEEYEVAVVCVAHPNKNEQSKAINRVSGSLAFVAAARAAFYIAKDPDMEDQKLFIPVKNNIGNDRTGLAFNIEGYTLDSGIQTSRIVWQEGEIEKSADQVMGEMQSKNGGNSPALEEAMAFLQDLLADGPVPKKEIDRETEEAGQSLATIKRAKKELGIIAQKDGMNGGWVWTLPPKVIKEAEGDHANTMSIFGDE